MVVAAGPEPAVVEDVAFDAERRGPFGQVEQVVEVVVEIDRFPDVDRDRPVDAGMVVAGPQEAVEAAGHLVETDSVGAVQPRGGVRLAFGELNFTGQQQFSAADDLFTGGQPLGVVGVVAAPSGVHAPDLAGGEGEPGRADVQDRCRIRSRAAFAALA